MQVCTVMGTPENSDSSPRTWESLPIWEYATPGPLRERLSGLTLAGRKTATFDVPGPDDPSTPIGSHWVMVGSDGARLAILEVTEVIDIPIAEVPWDLVDAEGESFVDLDHWRRAHEAYWASIGVKVGPETTVRCERFRLVQALPGAAQARFPVVEVLVPHDDVEWVSAELAELDTIGIEELSDGSTTNGTAIPAGHVLLRSGFTSDEQAAHAEAVLSGSYWRRFEVLIGDDWLDAWRDGFEPVEIGRFVVWPDWQDRPAGSVSDASILVRFDPGRAWGTGGHQSTKLALELLQQLPGSEVADARVLDAGCGSGLLAIAAALMGAEHVDAVDIDMGAPAVVAANASRNGVDHRVWPSTESVADISRRCAGSYGVVFANILAPVLIELAPDLIRALAPTGKLILAGLIDSQVDTITAAFAPLCVVETVADGVWRGLMVQH